VDKDLLHNKIIREVIALISSGAFRAGQKLPAERSLCQRFTVSRGTLRKALSQLEKLGLVTIKANSGAWVRDHSPADLPERFLPPGFERVTLEDVIVARKAIETAAMTLACERITAAGLAALRRLLAKMANAVDDLPRFLALDMEFHQAVIRSTRNMVLVTAFDAIYEYHRYSQVMTSQQAGEELHALEFHRRILQALEQRDVEACRAIANLHLDALMKYNGVKRPKARKSV
jgi:GntR family transcriptional regulator, transcriptional repressor for pyruvate dehydrogenase complex